MVHFIYAVYLEEELVAKCQELEYALVLVNGLYDKYYNEPNLKISIKRKDISLDEGK